MHKLILTCLALCFLSCRNKTNGDSIILKSPGKNDSVLVVVNQTGNDKEMFKYFDYFGNSQQTPFSNRDTLFINCKTPIVAYNTNSRDFSDLTYYILSPSDTIFIKMNGTKRIFVSNNKILENKITLMGKLLFNVGSMNYSNRDDFGRGIKSINEFYLKRKQIIQNNKNNVDDNTFKEANDIVNYDKLAALLILYTQFNIKNDTVLTTLAKADSAAWNYLTFRNVINNYMIYTNKVYQINALTTFAININKKFPVSIKDYAMFYFLNSYKPDNKKKLDTLNELVKRFSNGKKYDKLSAYLKINLEKYNNTFEQQNSKTIGLLNINNKQVSLGALIKQNRGKLIYIDFWASWCAPCLAEMPGSSILSRKYRSTNSSVAFIYLSSDANMAVWKSKSFDLKIPQDESFILLKNPEFENFSNKYRIKTIPRYMLIGKKGEMIDPDALRPSDPNLKLELDKLLK